MPYKLNIPKNLVEFKDGGLSFRDNYDATSTKSVLILGKSVDGLLEPTAVDINTVSKIFGKDVDITGNPNGGTIATDVNDIYRAGCRDIRAMKISGATAKAKISGPAKNVTTLEKKEGVIGYVGGNESTTIILNNSGVIQETISIFVNDKLLSCNFGFVSASSTITIPGGVCEASKSVTVKYQYVSIIPDVQYSETLIVSAENTVSLEKTPKDGSVEVLINDVEVPPNTYTIAAKIITFTAGVRKRAVTVGENDIVVVNYLSEEEQVLEASDNSKNGVAYVTATAVQIFTLPENPNKGTVVVYANDREVPKKYFAVAGTKINVKKEMLTFGEELVASYLISKNVDNKSVIELESFLASSIYNSGTIEVSEILNADDVLVGKQIIIEKPREKQALGEKPLIYSSLKYPTFGSLVNAISLDIRGGVYKASTQHDKELTSTLDIVKTTFSGGDSGLNATNEEIKIALSGKRDSEGYLIEDGVYQLLEGYNVDYIILSGVYADDIISTKESFAYDLAMYCAMSSHKNKTIFGSIAVAPCKNTTLKGIKDYVEKLSKFNADGKEFLLKEDGKIIEDSEGKTTDLGMYVRVVGGTEPLYLNDDLGKHAANPAVVYTGLQSILNPQSSPLNKALKSSKGLRFRLNEAQLSQITRANIISFVQKQNSKGELRDEAYVFDSMTCANPDSDYVRTTACEVVRLIADDVREVADPFIGEPPVVESRNSFAAALSKRFSQRKTEGAIHDLSFEIIETPQMMLLGDCNVAITVVTPGERRRINTTIGLKPML